MDTTRHRTTTDTHDTEVRREVAGLHSRARSLRHQAESLDELLALTYRRRASELELEAWLLEVQFGLTVTEAHTSAA